MKYLPLIYLLFLYNPCKAQSSEIDSVQKELFRLFTNANHKEACLLADKYLPVLKSSYPRDDSVYATFLYYSTIVYGLQKNYKKSEETVKELEDIVSKRFGEKNMRYYSTLTTYYWLLRRRFELSLQFTFQKKARSVLAGLLTSPDSTFSGFETNYHKDDIKFCLLSCLFDIAITYMATGKILETKNIFKEYMLYYDEKYLLSHDPRGYLEIKFSQGSFYINIEELEEAERIYAEAVNWAIKNYSETHPTYAETLVTQASFYLTTGNYDHAEKILLRAKLIFENTLKKTAPEYLNTIRTLCDIYLLKNNIPAAKDYIQLLKRLTSKFDTTDIVSYTKYIYPAIYIGLKTKQLDKTDSVLKILDTFYTSRPAILTEPYKNYTSLRAAYYTEIKEFEKADSFYSILLKQEYENPNVHSFSYANISLQKAANYMNWQKNDSAKKYTLQSIEEITAVLRKNFTFFSDNQRQNYLNKSVAFFDALYKITAELQTDDLLINAYNSLLLLKGLLLKTSVLNSRQLQWKDSLHKELFSQYIELRKAIITEASKPALERYDPDELSQEAEKLEKKLTKLSGNFIEEQFQSKKVSEVSKSLGPSEAAIEFLNYTSSDSIFYGALVVTDKNPKPVFVKLFLEQQLDSLLKQKSINTITTINSIYLNPSLFHIIWQPLEKYLTNIKKIYFALSGLLYHISLSALASDSNEFLSDKYSLTQVNTTASIIKKSNYTIKSSDKVLLYGGIVYDADSISLKLAADPYKNNGLASRSFPADLDRSGSFPYLPGTEAEVSQIKKSGLHGKFLVTIIKGINANEESIKKLNNKNSPAILHIATHGFFFPDPKRGKTEALRTNLEGNRIFKQSENPLFRAGIAMAGAGNTWENKPVSGVEDGILTAYEISNLYLPNTKLVVLSACETGLGDIKGTEGVYGLQRSFNMAGVQNLIMSLWKVPDVETAEFMTFFYKNIFNGEPIDEAFRDTQTFMKNKYRNEPYKWAAWILVR